MNNNEQILETIEKCHRHLEKFELLQQCDSRNSNDVCDIIVLITKLQDMLDVSKHDIGVSNIQKKNVIDDDFRYVRKIKTSINSDNKLRIEMNYNNNSTRIKTEKERKQCYLKNGGIYIFMLENINNNKEKEIMKLMRNQNKKEITKMWCLYNNIKIPVKNYRTKNCQIEFDLDFMNYQ